PIVRWLQRGYTAMLSRIVARPLAAYVTFAVVVVLGILVVPQLGQSLFPAFKQRDLLIHWDAIPGTSDAEMVRTTPKLSEEVLTGSKQAVAVRVYGQDLNDMRGKANQILGVISGVPGVIDQHVDLSVDTPQIQVQVDIAKAAQYRLKPGDVRRAAAAMIAG